MAQRRGEIITLQLNLKTKEVRKGCPIRNVLDKLGTSPTDRVWILGEELDKAMSQD